jgi:hypothetical protein
MIMTVMMTATMMMMMMMMKKCENGFLESTTVRRQLSQSYLVARFRVGNS